ncbi:MAG: HPr kinase/phosphatase C-terminal domain-containing protein [Sphingobium sp.]|nr:HPr kinase/phosphatase C-terminal domain-containing protein [Sphingobium sp.]
MAKTIHATCVAIEGHGLLIMGASGSGKSDLALRLIDRGAVLVSDDYTAVTASDGRLRASPPTNIAGLLEIRHIGIVNLPYVIDVPIALAIALDEKPQRMPDQPAIFELLDLAVPCVALAGLEASAPIKAEMMLARFGRGVEL